MPSALKQIAVEMQSQLSSCIWHKYCTNERNMDEHLWVTAPGLPWRRPQHFLLDLQYRIWSLNCASLKLARKMMHYCSLLRVADNEQTLFYEAYLDDLDLMDKCSKHPSTMAAEVPTAHPSTLYSAWELVESLHILKPLDFISSEANILS